jgi:hypothetical protein
VDIIAFGRILGLVPVAFAVVVVGCSSAMPGASLGTYKVVGQSQSNSCGLGAPNPWTFDVQLSESGKTLYWDWLDGSPLLSGSVASSQVTINQTSEVNADSTDAGLGPCNLNTSSTFTLTLGSGGPPNGFSGTMSYSYAPASGATCSDVLTSGGGMYDNLPCSLTYTVTATRQ